jgi:hypothetical protein
MTTSFNFRAAISKAEPIVRKKFEAMLPLSGWPSNVRDKVTLNVTPEYIEVVWPTDLDKKVQDLEYGTLGKSPSHFIKQTEKMIDNEVSAALSELTVDFVMERGF